MSLRDQLQAIYERNGRLTPAVLVETARPKEHPLHDRVFDKPVKEAAEAYYLQRAHDLIQSVKIVYREADEQGREKSVRAWHAIRSDEGHEYHPAEKVAADPFLSRLLMNDMERDWKALRRRYEEFSEFWQLIRSDVEEMEAA